MEELEQRCDELEGQLEVTLTRGSILTSACFRVCNAIIFVL